MSGPSASVASPRLQVGWRRRPGCSVRWVVEIRKLVALFALLFSFSPNDRPPLKEALEASQKLGSWGVCLLDGASRWQWMAVVHTLQGLLALT